MLVAIISFAAAIASIVLAVREVRGWRTNATAASSSEKDAAPAKTGRVPYRASGVAWALAFLAIQVFIGVWGALGLVQNEPVAPIIMNAVLTGCVYLSLARPRLRSRLREPEAG